MRGCHYKTRTPICTKTGERRGRRPNPDERRPHDLGHPRAPSPPLRGEPRRPRPALHRGADQLPRRPRRPGGLLQREHPPHGRARRVGCAATAGAAAKFGTVECREAKCIAPTFDAGPSENSAELLDVLKDRRRTAPPHDDQSDRRGHRTGQARPGTPGREEPRPHIPGPRTRCVGPGCGAHAGNQYAQNRSGRAAEQQSWQQDSLPLSLWERYVFVTVPQLPAPGKAKPGTVYRP
jgi:hypothetical protein